ncbi:hypothetical protein HJFPF1_10990 [Paramyrothecium foliicola]|nr:hypothetical protein HJFPF1_10990 [Paramyrothecium foliicola]
MDMTNEYIEDHLLDESWRIASEDSPVESENFKSTSSSAAGHQTYGSHCPPAYEQTGLCIDPAHLEASYHPYPENTQQESTASATFPAGFSYAATG